MPADTSVKLIHSAMAGAPTLSPVAGNLISVLNAALVDGFGSNTVDSLVIAGGVATVTRAAGHPFEAGTVALISGATVTSGSVNGQQKVLSATATSYTFEATGIGDQTATGTISHSVAPLGWGRPFAGSSTVQVYRSADTAGTRLYLRVDDTGTNNARVIGYESMSDVNTGVGPFPTTAQVSGGQWWPKCLNGSSNRPWMVIGDGRIFYLWVQWNSAGSGYSAIQAFGDFTSRKSPDPWACLINGSASDLMGASQTSNSFDYSATGTSPLGCYSAKGYSGLGSAAVVQRCALNPRGTQNLYSGESSTAFMAFPNPADNTVFLVPMSLQELSTPSCYRGEAPGIYFLPHNVGPGVFSLRERLSGVTGYAGKTFVCFPSQVGACFFDLTGPWR